MNFIHDLDLGTIDEMVNTVIEIPKGSIQKIEYRQDPGIFELDRVEPEIFRKPANYGFIPQTWDDDNDALDTLVITEDPLFTGIVVKARVVAVLHFVDNGEKDHKVICVPHDDRNSGDATKDLSDLGEAWKARVEYHFNHYKDLKKPGTTKVEGWGDAKAAWEIIKECSTRYKEKFSK